jgi:hypothetical protein
MLDRLACDVCEDLCLQLGVYSVRLGGISIRRILFQASLNVFLRLSSLVKNKADRN